MVRVLRFPGIKICEQCERAKKKWLHCREMQTSTPCLLHQKDPFAQTNCFLPARWQLLISYLVKGTCIFLNANIHFVCGRRLAGAVTLKPRAESGRFLRVAACPSYWKAYVFLNIFVRGFKNARSRSTCELCNMTVRDVIPAKSFF